MTDFSYEWPALQDRTRARSSFAETYLQIHDAQTRSARDELARLHTLIDDACERLMASFGAMEALTDSGQPPAAEDIEHAVANAVSALQFQDMATQLLAHATRRIALLETLTDSLRRLPDSTAEELMAAVDAAGCGRRGGPVEQACMTGGSIELF